LNTWLTFTLAIPLKVAQFPVGVNTYEVLAAMPRRTAHGARRTAHGVAMQTILRETKKSCR
jgi:hypothetical protein